MRNFTVFLAIFVAATAILAAPSAPGVFIRGKVRTSEVRSGRKHAGHQIRSIISLRYLSKMATRDSFSDLIERELGQSPTSFLEDIDTLFKDVNRVVNEGTLELDKAHILAGPLIKIKINGIRKDALGQLVRLTERFLIDLGRVLIGLPTGTTHYDPIADLIRSILCKTLQQFVENIKNALEQASGILSDAVDATLDLADEARPEVGLILRDVANRQLYRGRTLIAPVLDTLRNLLNFKRMMIARAGLSAATGEQKDLLDATVLSVFGFSPQTAAHQAEDALSELASLMESSRADILEALALSDGGGGGDNEVQTKVVESYDAAMDGFIEDVKPIFRMGSLPGVGMDYYSTYLQHESIEIEKNLNRAFSEIVETASEGGAETASRVSEVLQKQKESAKTILEPLMETLKPVLEKSKENKTEVQAGRTRALKEEEEGEWLDSDGALYNRNALIHAVSHELGFDVEEGAITLKTSLQNLDDVMGLTLLRLDTILNKHKVEHIQPDIIGIMNETLIDVHVAVQPMLNVLLPFIPDGIRSNKHIALDIYTGISEVDNIDEFLHYCSAAAKDILRITNEAMTEIQAVVGKETPEAHAEIESLLQTAQELTKQYIMPFIEVIRPILSPHV